MIFVILGTQDKNFTRLLISMEDYARKNNEEVIVQAGYTTYESDVMRVKDFVSQDDFETYMKEASVVVTHAGVGSILTALKYHKPIVAAARELKYKEHTNDHQKEILDRFYKDGYVIAVKDFTKMETYIEQAKQMDVKEYVSNQKEFTNQLKNYIDSI